MTRTLHLLAAILPIAAVAAHAADAQASQAIAPAEVVGEPATVTTVEAPAGSPAGSPAGTPDGTPEILPAENAASANPEKGWFDSAWENITRTYNEGTDELLVPTYTWHLPFAYTREKVKEYQNYPIGLGYGRGRIDQKGNYHGIYAMGFQDSHFTPEWIVGYVWKTFWNLGGGFQGGLGFTTGVTARADYSHYLPVPLIFPMGSLEYGRWSLDVAYIPGGKGNGNVMFFTNKWRFAN